MNQDFMVIGKGQELVSKLTDQRAKKYLRFGFIIRALQIKESWFQLNGLLEKDGGKNRNPYETVQTNIYLNSFYLNLLGKSKGARLELNPAKPLAPNSPGVHKLKTPLLTRRRGFSFLLFLFPSRNACYVKPGFRPASVGHVRITPSGFQELNHALFRC